MPFKNKDIKKEYLKKYYIKNKETILSNSKSRYKLKSKEVKEYQKKYNELNKEKVSLRSSEYGKKWRKENRAKCNFYVYKRRTFLMERTSETANMNLIKQFYILAESLTQSTGIKYVVDHIKPLSKGGLHHQDNLQVITMEDNLRKFNKYPFEVVNYFNPQLVQVEHT